MAPNSAMSHEIGSYCLRPIQPIKKDDEIYNIDTKLFVHPKRTSYILILKILLKKNLYNSDSTSYSRTTGCPKKVLAIDQQ